MSATSSRIRFSLALILLISPAFCSAIWVCHTDDGRVWQQENPPCVTPADQSALSPQPKPDKPVRPSKPARTAQAANRVQITQAPTEKTLYDRAVADVEQQYPALNPDSQSFDRALVQRVLKQKQMYVQKAYGEDYALRAAVTDLLENKPALTAETQAKSHGYDALIEAGAKGAGVGVLLAAITIAALIFRWLLRRSRTAVVQAAYVVGNTSVKDIARKVGGASAKVERKTSGVLGAFQDGRREAKERDELR